MNAAGLLIRLIAFEKAVDMRKVAGPAGIEPNATSGTLGAPGEGGVEASCEGGGAEAFRAAPHLTQVVALSALGEPQLLQNNEAAVHNRCLSPFDRLNYEIALLCTF